MQSQGTRRRGFERKKVSIRWAVEAVSPFVVSSRNSFPSFVNCIIGINEKQAEKWLPADVVMHLSYHWKTGSFCTNSREQREWYIANAIRLSLLFLGRNHDHRACDIFLPRDHLLRKRSAIRGLWWSAVGFSHDSSIFNHSIFKDFFFTWILPISNSLFCLSCSFEQCAVWDLKKRQIWERLGPPFWQNLSGINVSRAYHWLVRVNPGDDGIKPFIFLPLAQVRVDVTHKRLDFLGLKKNGSIHIDFELQAASSISPWPSKCLAVLRPQSFWGWLWATENTWSASA